MIYYLGLFIKNMYANNKSNWELFNYLITIITISDLFDMLLEDIWIQTSTHFVWSFLWLSNFFFVYNSLNKKVLKKKATQQIILKRNYIVKKFELKVSLLQKRKYGVSCDLSKSCVPYRKSEDHIKQWSTVIVPFFQRTTYKTTQTKPTQKKGKTRISWR